MFWTEELIVLEEGACFPVPFVRDTPAVAAADCRSAPAGFVIFPSRNAGQESTGDTEIASGYRWYTPTGGVILTAADRGQVPFSPIEFTGQ